MSASNLRRIAYFSMEIGFDARIPTYSGGLGILAGDTIRAAADLKVPMVAVTLLHRKGYFYQRLDASGEQREEPVAWVIEDFLTEMPARASVAIEGRTVQLRAWEYRLEGSSGATVPIYFLDADLPENLEQDRHLTDFLYGGDQAYRLSQEIILGIGGVRILRALGHNSITRFHMNEGHASLLGLELVDERVRSSGREKITADDIAAVRGLCVFTTHTPVPAGHDLFPMDLVHRVLGRREIMEMKEVFCCNGVLNMTYLALNLSHYVNGVAKRHGELSRAMFGQYTIDSITNGIHAGTWASPPFAALFDRYIPGWRQDNFNLRYALGIPTGEIWQAHTEAKKRLIDYANHETNAGLSEQMLTIGFARRATAYKRADLIFTDLERLRAIARKAGPFQLIFAGKAHPNDRDGKELIRRIFKYSRLLHPEIGVVYLEHYNIEISALMVAGADLWLNTPEPPMEASGTSGMKAALNGVPSLSVLDGWWIEGHIEGVTGWAMGSDSRDPTHPVSRADDAASLYDKLEQAVLPAFYNQRDRFLEIMRHCIALNGSFFNTHRMIQQYVLKAYF